MKYIIFVAILVSSFNTSVAQGKANEAKKALATARWEIAFKSDNEEIKALREKYPELNKVLKTDLLKKYVDKFNADDEELFSNIKNKDAFAFLKDNIPLFECPDEDFERTYYFRWWYSTESIYLFKVK